MAQASHGMGPVDYLVVEFPGDHTPGEGLPLLVDLVDRGVIRILDLAFVRKGQDGSVVRLTPADVAADNPELRVFEGASSNLLNNDDVEEASAAIEPGRSAGILIYENTWAAPFAAALRRGGGELVASGRIPADAVLEALGPA